MVYENGLKAAIREGKKQILKDVFALSQKLQTLAPNPANTNDKGPALIRDHAINKRPGNQDGMAGTMILENMLGLSFMAAANENVQALSKAVNWDMLIEGASEYLEGRGKGTYARAESARNTSSHGGPSLHDSPKSLSAAFNSDMPKRREIAVAVGPSTVSDHPRSRRSAARRRRRCCVRRCTV